MKLRKKLISLTLAVLSAVTLVGCGSAGSGSSSSKKGVAIRVGSKDFTENEIVAEVYALALENAGYKVDRTFDIASSVIHKSITSDEIDLYPEYTGTGLISILGEDPITDPDDVYKGYA